MAKNIKRTKTELEMTKEQMIQSFDKNLANISATKEELEKARERWREQGLDENIIEEEIQRYDIRKKLQIVLQEKGHYDKLDEAIAFLDDILNRNKKNS